MNDRLINGLINHYPEVRRALFTYIDLMTFQAIASGLRDLAITAVIGMVAWPKIKTILKERFS